VSENYKDTTPFANLVDLAVIQTREPIQFSANVGPIALGTTANCPTCVTPAQLQIVSGFGNQNADSRGSSNPSSTLLYVDQQIVSRATCTAVAGAIPVGNICAGPINGETGTDRSGYSCFIVFGSLFTSFKSFLQLPGESLWHCICSFPRLTQS
jgi:hypothetical protein